MVRKASVVFMFEEDLEFEWSRYKVEEGKK